MKIEQKEWTKSQGWTDKKNNQLSANAQLVLVFGCKNVLIESDRFEEMRQFYPNADIVSCSTAGEILDTKISEESISLTAVSFESTSIATKKVQITKTEETTAAGIEILDDLRREDLVYVLVLSDGQIVNGSELVECLGENLGDDVVVTGGMAGDGPNFGTTLVGLNEAPANGNIVGIGFYGKNLKVGHAARGGWDPFGPERVITKSKDNILYELDDHSVLDLYKKYLGELAADLPGSALLFPLGIKLKESNEFIVRTVLGVNEEDQSMIFAGGMPEGATVRMMRSNFDRLVDASSAAAHSTMEDFGSFNPDLAIVISCAGRKFVLQEHVGEEIDKVREVLGNNTVISGFYAYGEISPVVKSTKCELHNQTMTITTLKEVSNEVVE